MAAEPPDPGGTIPPEVGANITIDSSMDTDGSVRSETRKRSRALRRICKTCNKKRRQHKPANGKVGCSCDSDGNEEKVDSTYTKTSVPQASTLADVAPTINQGTTSSQQQPQVGRSRYDSTDVAPFVVHIQKDGETSTVHPISFGHYLKKRGVKNIINGSVKRLGRSKLSLSFSTFSDANAFLNDPDLTLKQFKAFIPTFNVTRMGVVKGVPVEWSAEEIQSNISVPIGCGKVLKARRFNYKVHGPPVEWKPSQTVVLTFDGQVLPKRVFLCYNSLPVELYSFPTIQCFNCCRFGHTKAKCNSKPRCYKCGQDHSGDSCNIESDVASCLHCDGQHFATSRSCPEFERQTSVKVYMAQNCVSYAEAIKLHPPVSKPFRDVLSSAPSPNFSSQPQPTATTSEHAKSHKKTVFLKPRPAPKTAKGYDRAEHRSLTADYDAPSPLNGCAVPTSPPENSVIDIILALIKALSPIDSNISQPTNAANIYKLIFSLLTKNGQPGQNNTVEL